MGDRYRRAKEMLWRKARPTLPADQPAIEVGTWMPYSNLLDLPEVFQPGCGMYLAGATLPLTNERTPLQAGAPSFFSVPEAHECPTEQLPADVARAVMSSRTMYEPMPCGLMRPVSGNVPLVHSLDLYPSGAPVPDQINPWSALLGPNQGTYRNAGWTTLTGKIQNGPIAAYLNTAEIRGISPSLAFTTTFPLDSFDKLSAQPQTVFSNPYTWQLSFAQPF